MKHLLNNLSEEEKNSIRGQHTGGMQVNNGRFNSLLENKLGNSKPLVEQFEDELYEGYEDDYTASGFDSMGDAAHSALKSKGHSHRGKDDEGEFYIVFDGEKFYKDDFEIAHYNDMGKIPRVEDGKLIIANPAWGA